MPQRIMHPSGNLLPDLSAFSTVEAASAPPDESPATKISLKTIEEDVDREKSIVIDANSNQKRLNDENDKLVEIDSKYYETEKKSDQD